MLALMMMVGPVGLNNDTGGAVKETKDTASIKKKTRSLNGHKLQLFNHTRDCTGKIEQYKAYKTLEASDRVDQVWQKVLDQQVKIGEIFDELHILDEEQEEAYSKQEDELNGQVDELAKRWETAKREVATALRASTQVVTNNQAVATGPPPVRKLEVKLTEFRVDAADQWFEETERALATARVTDEVEKIVCIQRYIPERIREAKRSLFGGSSYQAVKDAVIKAVEKTEEEKFKAFLAVQLGDRKPSEAWAELTKIMPVDAQEFQDLVMKQKFLAVVGTDLAQHLTDDTLTLASGLDTEEIEKYVQKVDKLYANKKPRAAVHSVKKDTDSKETEVSEVKSKREFEKQKGNSRRRDNRSGSNKRRGNYRDRMCKLHDRFGEKAYSCDKPDECPMAKLTTKRPEKPEKK